MALISNIIFFWIAVAGIMLVVEAITLGLTTIWFAGGAAAALLVSFLGAPIWLQGLIFVVVSVLLLVLTRPIAIKHVNNRSVKTNADSLIGREAVVTQRIDNLGSTGRVQVSGQDWTARSVRPEQCIEVGETVMIRNIEGVKLIVGKRIEQTNNEEVA